MEALPCWYSLSHKRPTSYFLVVPRATIVGSCARTCPAVGETQVGGLLHKEGTLKTAGKAALASTCRLLKIGCYWSTCCASTLQSARLSACRRRSVEEQRVGLEYTSLSHYNPLTVMVSSRAGENMQHQCTGWAVQAIQGLSKVHNDSVRHQCN